MLSAGENRPSRRAKIKKIARNPAKPMPNSAMRERKYGTAQIALFLLAIVIGLLLLERASRRGRRFHDLMARQKNHRVVKTRLSGFKGLAAFLTCAIPIMAGFGVPVPDRYFCQTE